ncbi:MAG: aminopeptidase [Bacteroidia bacterium]|nr:aminopeptidase [Bacteroidia bacterium]
MKLSKKIRLGIIAIIILLVVFNLPLLSYSFAQLKGQLEIIRNAESFDTALNSSDYTQKQKDKIKLVAEIKRFAIDSLGLNESKSYQNIYNQHGNDVLWTITACKPFAFEAHEWSFPFLGNVPYKGFFDYEKGNEEFEEIKNTGLDAEYSSVSGWSTLGWFGDPLLSKMLKRSEGSLADLIIHELTHGTIYIKNEADYNENLATFIGNKGAVEFLSYKYGENSKELSDYLNYQADRKKYVAHILEGSNQLDSLYKNFNSELSDASKEVIKNEMILQVVNNIDTIGFNNPKRFEWDLYKKPLPNNTFFMSYLRYRKKQNSFDSILESKFENDLKKLIKYSKETQTMID